MKKYLLYSIIKHVKRGMVSMKLMPNINFTQQELNERFITDMYSVGGEACVILSDNPQT